MPSLRIVLACSGLALAAVASAQQSPPPPAANGRHPVVSPDGRRIAFSADRGGVPGVYVIDADGSNAVRLAIDGKGASRPTWNRAGTRLLFGVLRGDTTRIVSAPADGGAPTELAVLRTPGAKAVAVSSDGSRVVYGAGDWMRMQLMTASADGAAPKQITDGSGAYWCHTLSRDGKRVAVNRTDSTRTMQEWVLNVDGTNARQVTRFAEGSPQCASWSSDGRKLALQSSVRDPADAKKEIGSIWVVDVETGAATKLGAHTAPYLDELPSWFPDGKRIAFQSDRTGRWEIWAINVDGSELRQITK